MPVFLDTGHQAYHAANTDSTLHQVMFKNKLNIFFYSWNPGGRSDL